MAGRFAAGTMTGATMKEFPADPGAATTVFESGRTEADAEAGTVVLAWVDGPAAELAEFVMAAAWRAVILFFLSEGLRGLYT